MFDKELSKKFLKHIEGKTLEELEEKASKAPCSGVFAIIDEFSELTEEQVEWLLSRTLKDGPKLSKAVKDFREIDHGEEFDLFEGLRDD